MFPLGRPLIYIRQPIIEPCMYVYPRSAAKAGAERLYFAPAKPPRPLIWRGMLVREPAPNGVHHELVNVPQLTYRDERMAHGLPTYRVGVDPLRGVSIALDLQILAQVLVPDSAAFLQQGLDLPEYERVALHGGRMMGLFVPDTLPNALGLNGQRQAAHGGKIAQTAINPC
jgi:hypothetical protein